MRLTLRKAALRLERPYFIAPRIKPINEIPIIFSIA
jgi:hypothetical protein